MKWVESTASPMALPWAGPRAPLRPLGFDENGELSEDELSENGFGSGMLRRRSLRTLVEELDPQPRGRSGQTGAGGR